MKLPLTRIHTFHLPAGIEYIEVNFGPDVIFRFDIPQLIRYSRKNHRGRTPSGSMSIAVRAPAPSPLLSPVTEEPEGGDP